MSRFVIDTNVPIVANGREESVKIDCRIAAIQTLQNALASGRIFLDSEGAIQDEYRRYLSPSGQPGVGDMFYREVLNSHPDRVVRVDIARRPDGEYEDLPQAIIDVNFDPSDRKFAAVAVRANAKVCNAIDSDWLEQREVIEANGIEIIFVCGCDPNEWHQEG